MSRLFLACISSCVMNSSVKRFPSSIWRIPSLWEAAVMIAFHKNGLSWRNSREVFCGGMITNGNWHAKLVRNSHSKDSASESSRLKSGGEATFSSISGETGSEVEGVIDMDGSEEVDDDTG